MKKGICIALVILLFVCAICTACATLYRPESPPAGWPEELPYLNLAQRNEIDQAMLHSPLAREIWPWFSHEYTLSEDSVRKLLSAKCYLGTYQEYDVFCFPAASIDARPIIIGNEKFSPATFYYTHRNGELCALADVYEQGLISDESLAEIAQVSRNYEKYQIPAWDSIKGDNS